MNVRSLRASEGEPCLDINRGDAESRTIVYGTYVRVFNDRGSLVLRARVTDKARRNVLVAPSVWWKKLSRDGKNANQLTSGTSLTDMGRGAIFYDCLVPVEPLQTPAKQSSGAKGSRRQERLKPGERPPK